MFLKQIIFKINMVKQTYLLVKEAQEAGIGDDLPRFLRASYDNFQAAAHVESETALGQMVRIANVDCRVRVWGFDRVGLELSVNGELHASDIGYVIKDIALKYGHEHPIELFEGPIN
jgi:hypothetical protein